MPARFSEKDAKAIMARLLDPILAPKNPVSEAGLPSSAPKPTAHRTPKVARRVTTKAGPEGRGRVRRDEQGRVLGVDIALDLLPVPKERPRVVRTKSGQVMSYTPPRTKRFTADVRAVLDAVMGMEPAVAGPVSLTMVFLMQIPERWPLWKQQAARDGLVAPTGRPDMDNLEKALLDALNGRAFVDDAYVVDRIAVKRYADTPGILLRLDALSAGALTARRADMNAHLGLPPSPLSFDKDSFRD